MNPLFKVYNSGNNRFIKLVFSDYVFIESCLPLENSPEWGELSEDEKVTCYRVREIIALSKSKYENYKEIANDKA